MKVCTAQWKNINMQSLSEHNCEFYALGCDMILNYLLNVLFSIHVVFVNKGWMVIILIFLDRNQR